MKSHSQSNLPQLRQLTVERKVNTLAQKSLSTLCEKLIWEK